MTTTTIKYKPTLDIFISSNLRLKRIFNLTEREIDNYEYPVTAWFTIKIDPRISDTSALVQKIITTTETSNGHITTPISPSWSSATTFIFEVSPADLAVLEHGHEYYYDIKYLTDKGNISTAFIGKLYAKQNVTKSLS